MKQQIQTIGMVLARTDYQEADRILTLLTPDHGKQRVIAKGVRRPKSKLAGGIELFSISDVSILPGRGDLGTLVSTRMKLHYGNIVKDIDRTMLGYELLKRMNRATEDALDPDYFELLRRSLVALDGSIDTAVLEIWFDAQLLLLAGHQPNLKTDNKGIKLEADKAYSFDFDDMSFAQSDNGVYRPDHIKLLRLVFGAHTPAKLQQVKNVQTVLPLTKQLVTGMRTQYAH